MVPYPENLGFKPPAFPVSLHRDPCTWADPSIHEEIHVPTTFPTTCLQLVHVIAKGGEGGSGECPHLVDVLSPGQEPSTYCSLSNVEK